MQTPALVRTAVPMAVGAIASALTTWNIALSDEAEHLLGAGLTGLFGLVYYVALYLLESRWPMVGLLLGSTARPSYTGRHRKGLPPATATPGAPDTSEVDRQLP